MSLTAWASAHAVPRPSSSSQFKKKIDDLNMDIALFTTFVLEVLASKLLLFFMPHVVQSPSHFLPYSLLWSSVLFLALICLTSIYCALGHVSRMLKIVYIWIKMYYFM